MSPLRNIPHAFTELELEVHMGSVCVCVYVCACVCVHVCACCFTVWIINPTWVNNHPHADWTIIRAIGGLCSLTLVLGKVVTLSASQVAPVSQYSALLSIRSKWGTLWALVESSALYREWGAIWDEVLC